MANSFSSEWGQTLKKSLSRQSRRYKVWFIAKLHYGEDTLGVVLTKAANCRRRCSKCGSSLKFQWQKKDVSCVVYH